MRESKKEAMYEVNKPFVVGRCELCVYFALKRAPSFNQEDRCEIVKGKIDPNGWCRHIRIRK